MTKDEEDLTQDFKTVLTGLNSLIRRAKALGLEFDYAPYGSSEGTQFEFTLTRDVRELEVKIEREKIDERKTW